MKLAKATIFVLLVLAAALWAQDRRIISHATQHQNSGGDEVATATPGADAIPKAESDGDLANGWIGLDQSYSWTGAHTFSKLGDPVILLKNATASKDWALELAGSGTFFQVRDATGGTAPFAIQTGAASTTLRIAATSRVGIGLAAPAEKLDVGGAIQASTFVNPGSVLQAALPANGLTFCTDCNADATCTSSGGGAWARCRASSCECDW